jgi:hypothetical protein
LEDGLENFLHCYFLHKFVYIANRHFDSYLSNCENLFYLFLVDMDVFSQFIELLTKQHYKIEDSLENLFLCAVVYYES